MKDFSYEDSEGDNVELFMTYDNKPAVHVNDECYVILSADAVRGMRKWLKKALHQIEDEPEQDKPVSNVATFADFMNDEITFTFNEVDVIWVETNSRRAVRLTASDVDVLINWLKTHRKSM